MTTNSLALDRTSSFALDKTSEKIVRITALAAASFLGIPLVVFLIAPFII